MAEIDTFGATVRGMLEEWGREFALHRDCEYLGHKDKDVLALLIEHGGEMPPKVTGFKPIEISPRTQAVEDAVFRIARVNRTRATVLRAYYCGSGRRGDERLETCNALLAKMGEPALGRGKYFSEVELGIEAVRWILNEQRLAA